MNGLTEHGIGSYEELVERCDAVVAASIRTRENLRDTEQRIADLALLGKQIDTYRKLKPVYNRYKASKDKEKFLRGFERDYFVRGGSKGNQEGRTHQTPFRRKAENGTGWARRPQDRPANGTSEGTARGKGV